MANMEGTRRFSGAVGARSVREEVYGCSESCIGHYEPAYGGH